MAQQKARLERALSEMRTFSPSDRWKVPIQECGEPLLLLRKAAPLIATRIIVPQRRLALGEGLRARQTVCKMLNDMSRRLAPRRRVVVFDAYRPISYQRMRYQQTRKRLEKDNPFLSEEELETLTDRFVAHPNDDPQKAPPHSTGGAVDMFLEYADGTEMDFGSQPGVYTTEQNLRHVTHADGLRRNQIENRLELLRVAIEFGFCSYPGEWWHFMYGDQEYTLYEGLPSAIYGRADLLAGYPLT